MFFNFRTNNNYYLYWLTLIIIVFFIISIWFSFLIKFYKKQFFKRLNHKKIKQIITELDSNIPEKEKFKNVSKKLSLYSSYEIQSYLWLNQKIIIKLIRQNKFYEINKLIYNKLTKKWKTT